MRENGRTEGRFHLIASLDLPDRRENSDSLVCFLLFQKSQRKVIKSNILKTVLLLSAQAGSEQMGQETA